MNKDETLNLFNQGKAAWNAWAQDRLAERRAWAEDDTWPEGKNPPWENADIKRWRENATADFSDHTFEADVDFDGWVFPSHVYFRETQFSGGTNFSEAQFSRDAYFAEAQFAGDATFEEAQFSGDATFEEAQFAGDATFEEAQFSGDATFEEALFSGNAAFSKAQFSGYAAFSKAQFSGYAAFREAQFSGYAGFSDAQFSGDAAFREAQFSGDAAFSDAQFSGHAAFSKAQFSGNANFSDAQFSGDAAFSKAQFSGYAGFSDAQFSGDATFEEAQFSRDAYFAEAKFSGKARFWEAEFSGDATFAEAQFSGDATFEEAQFSRDADFAEAQFSGNAAFSDAQFSGYAAFSKAAFIIRADFRTATFTGNTAFENTRFKGRVDFLAAKSDRAFTLAGSVFDAVPDFSQMRFEEAPRLDNLRIQPGRFARPVRLYNGCRSLPKAAPRAGRRAVAKIRWWLGFATEKDRDLLAQVTPNDEAAKYRALQRLAERGHDYRLEQAFFRAELRERQFHDDWPWHPRFLGALFYEGISNFGASLVLPLAWLLVSTFIFAGLYLNHAKGSEVPFGDAVAGSVRHVAHAVAGTGPPSGAGCARDAKGNPYVDGNRYTAALSLSGRNTLLFAAGAFTEAQRKSLTCLYGYHRVAGRDQPDVPTAVTLLGALQTVVSLILFFLFGLALRNQFKIR